MGLCYQSVRMERTHLRTNQFGVVDCCNPNPTCRTMDEDFLFFIAVSTRLSMV